MQLYKEGITMNGQNPYEENLQNPLEKYCKSSKRW